MVMTQVRTPGEQLWDEFAAFVNQKTGGPMNRGGLSLGYKHDATGTPTTTYAHGPGGLFSYPGVDPQVFSAMLGIEGGLVGALPKFPSVYTNPLFTTITGVQADVGSEPEDVCDPAVEAGLTKACTLTSVFGRYRRKTREVYANRLGQYRDYADPPNLRLMNAYPGIAGGDPLMNPALTQPLNSAVLELEMAKILFEFGVSVNRFLSRQFFTGNPANNTAGEGYKELTGLDLLISTGKVDAITGQLCPALDSDIKDFNFQNLSTFGASDIVQVLTYMYRYVKNIARRSGLMPVRWAWVMREEAFYELTAVWPISYLTSAGTMGSVRDTDWQRGNINLTDAADQRDRMRRETYLLIDGELVQVLLDDGITELTNVTDGNVPAGCFASDIYLLPLTVLGGTPVTYIEYFQHDNASISQLLSLLNMQGQVWTTNNGAWIWNNARTDLCITMTGKVEPRLILRTPQLAGRLQNVVYCPLQHTRQPFPDDPYFFNGGVTSRTGPSYYSEWNPS